MATPFSQPTNQRQARQTRSEKYKPVRILMFSCREELFREEFSRRDARRMLRSPEDWGMQNIKSAVIILKPHPAGSATADRLRVSAAKSATVLLILID
ncbi:uncharacterized protein ColSpa_12029 [Colletotrichum spaethianum]|uniref:Uncharacterized protein n=1 Tax=Colletotrichum spaethianum TaxID=700344 RepID=A0AA37PGF4_9PEZI|nr:uncharacterized protein ColSpa_12029 [Colletotrichum spaethianum]GKT51848.1 hypothetical protein ColSpa_12029 [Colletotrichum spaethianum]